MEFFFDHYKAVRQFLFKSQKKNGTLHLGLIKHGGGRRKAPLQLSQRAPVNILLCCLSMRRRKYCYIIILKGSLHTTVFNQLNLPKNLKKITISSKIYCTVFTLVLLGQLISLHFLLFVLLSYYFYYFPTFLVSTRGFVVI